jgi:N4-gp56 family major capsid protein
MDDPDWKYPHQYVDTANIYNGELGSIAGVRFAETTEAKVFKAAGASSANVYATMILGQNAYGVTDIAGGGLQHIVKQLGSAGTADPLNQRATVGWKAIKTAVRLVEQYMVRIESTSSFATTEDN